MERGRMTSRQSRVRLRAAAAALCVCLGLALLGCGGRGHEHGFGDTVITYQAPVSGRDDRDLDDPVPCR